MAKDCKECVDSHALGVGGASAGYAAALYGAFLVFLKSPILGAGCCGIIGLCCHNRRIG